MAKVKCPHCGFENEEGIQFCDQCSTELTGAATVEKEQMPVAETGAPVSAEEAPLVVKPTEAVKAKLMVKRTGQVGHEFAIDQESMNVGRWDADSGAFPEVDLSDDDPGGHISRRHARIFVKEGEYFIEDIGSKNGTFVNKGPRLTPGSPQKLQNGDEIVIGRTFFTFTVG